MWEAAAPGQVRLLAKFEGIASFSLLVTDNGGKILLRRPGTSQEGSPIKVFQSSESSFQYPAALPSQETSIRFKFFCQ